MANPQNPNIPTKQNPEEQAIVQTQLTQGPTPTMPSFLKSKNLAQPRAIVTSEGARKRVADNIQFINSMLEKKKPQASEPVKMKEVRKQNINTK